MRALPQSLPAFVSGKLSYLLDKVLTFLDAVWASFFGFLYRKFFWDFIGGTLRDPGGLQYV